MSAFTDFLSAGERRVIRSLILHLLAKGCSISVFDGEEYCLKQCNEYRAIIDALASTESDFLKVRNTEREVVGGFTLVYGNDRSGSEVIADHVDNEFCNAAYHAAHR